MSSSSSTTPTCGMALKEWAGTCRALVEGRQVALLRKGGIEDGPRGFRLEHDRFWLYPTHFHEDERVLARPVAAAEDARSREVAIEALAEVVWVEHVDHLETLTTLAAHHDWPSEALERRFHYRRPGLWVVAVRVFRSTVSHHVPEGPDLAGCKSWAWLHEPLSTDGLVPVLDDETSERRLRLLQHDLRRA